MLLYTIIVVYGVVEHERVYDDDYDDNNNNNIVTVVCRDLKWPPVDVFPSPQKTPPNLS